MGFRLKLGWNSVILPHPVSFSKGSARNILYTISAPTKAKDHEAKDSQEYFETVVRCYKMGKTKAEVCMWMSVQADGWDSARWFFSCI